MIAFAIESALGLFLVAVNLLILELRIPAYFVFVWSLIAMAFSTIGTLMASPELRREYFGHDDSFIPCKKIT